MLCIVNAICERHWLPWVVMLENTIWYQENRLFCQHRTKTAKVKLASLPFSFMFFSFIHSLLYNKLTIENKEEDMHTQTPHIPLGMNQKQQQPMPPSEVCSFQANCNCLNLAHHHSHPWRMRTLLLSNKKWWRWWCGSSYTTLLLFG